MYTISQKLTKCKHYFCLNYQANICKEGGSAILELALLGRDTVIAKDADSQMQLTEPL